MPTNKYLIPNPVLDEKETNLLKAKTEQYNKLIEPGKLAKAGKKAYALVPQIVKDYGKAAKDSIAETQLFQQCMDVLAKGFSLVEKYAANITISEKTVIEKANRRTKENEITTLDEVCLARTYDIVALVNQFRKKNLAAAFLEGGATGFFGFKGIPFNIVASTFLFYRAVQSVAMHYGYDVKNNPDELVIAGDVLANAMSPSSQGSSEIGSMIAKVMAFAEVTTVKQTVGKTWTAMASRGGVCLFLTQIRALANKSAQKALENAGRVSIEAGVFKKVFEQIGKRLTKKVISRGVPVVGSAIGAAFDLKQMDTILDYADIFYCKRFIMEKEVRVNMLMNGSDNVIDADYTDVEE